MRRSRRSRFLGPGSLAGRLPQWRGVRPVRQSVGIGVGADDRQEVWAVLLQLDLADAGDTGERLHALGEGCRHVPEGHVAEDDVGRHVLGDGQPPAKGSQLFEKGRVGLRGHRR